jgi:hypothetical protein
MQTNSEHTRINRLGYNTIGTAAPKRQPSTNSTHGNTKPKNINQQYSVSTKSTRGFDKLWRANWASHMWFAADYSETLEVFFYVDR